MTDQQKIELAYSTDSFKWDRLSQKERLFLIERWEKEDAYPYGRSNSKRPLESWATTYRRERLN